MGKSRIFREIIDSEDVGMRQGGGGPGFPFEPRQELQRRERCRQDFERDLAAEPRVVRAIDPAHAPGTKGRQDLVSANACSSFEHELP